MGSFRTACRGHQVRSPQSVAWPSRRLAADSKHPGLFAQVVLARTHSGIRVTGRFAENGRSVSPIAVLVGPPVASLRAALRIIRTSSLSRACRQEQGSFDGPSNTQMEPTRPTVLCDPVTAARSSFATLYGQDNFTVLFRAVADIGVRRQVWARSDVLTRRLRAPSNITVNRGRSVSGVVGRSLFERRRAVASRHVTRAQA